MIGGCNKQDRRDFRLPAAKIDRIDTLSDDPWPSPLPFVGFFYNKPDTHTHSPHAGEGGRPGVGGMGGVCGWGWGCGWGDLGRSSKSKESEKYVRNYISVTPTRNCS